MNTKQILRKLLEKDNGNNYISYRHYELLNSKDVLNKALELYKNGKKKDLYDLYKQYPQYQEAIETAISFYEQLKQQL